IQESVHKKVGSPLSGYSPSGRLILGRRQCNLSQRSAGWSCRQTTPKRDAVRQTRSPWTLLPPKEIPMCRFILVRSKSLLSVRGGLLAVLVGLSLAATCSSQDKGVPKQSQDTKAAPKQITLNSLSMEVSALQTLHDLNLDKAQLEKVLQWS